MSKLASQNWSPTFVVGSILVFISSFTIGFFNIAILFWFGLPLLVFLLGLVLIWFSKEAFKRRIIVSLLSLPVIAASFLLYYQLLPKAVPEIFLVPDRFRGQVAIMFDETCGETGVFEGQSRVYRIPDNGILITKLPMTLGLLDRTFYLVDEAGNRTAMPEFHWSSFEREKDDWHWIFSEQKLSNDLVGVFWAYQRDFSCIISDYQTYEAEYGNSNERKKSFTKDLNQRLKECRQRISE